MKLASLRGCAALLLAGLLAGVMGGCSAPAYKGVSRIHLVNQGDEAVTFLAIGTSEDALGTAGNRLTRPIPAKSVYSAVLSRPGNYWIRTGVETDGYIVERLEGPIRVGEGVANWEFKKVDSRPLYAAIANAAHGAPAGRISFNNN